MKIAVWHIMPALRVGCTVVIKPSPLKPLSTLRMVELMNQALPPGVINAVTLRARLEATGQIDHEPVFFLETGAPFRGLQCPQVRWRKTLRSLNVRYRRPYTARQTSVSWNLMIGKNPLWVAKQHGHSIATMLRAYAAWEEGTAEVDVEAIKRSMNATEAPPTRNLAVNLSVAEALRTKSAGTVQLNRRGESCANRLCRRGKPAVNQTTGKLAGVEGLFGPGTGLTPSGPATVR